MKEKKLAIVLPGRQVGELTQDRSGLTRWLPDASWEREGQHPRLGTEFLRAPGSKHAGTGLPAWFENLLPEVDSPLRRRLCAAYGLRLGQSFALLSALGHELSGAVEAHSESSSESAGDEAEIAADDDPETKSLVMERRFSALAGMQLKFSMSMTNDRLAFPAHGKGGLWIVKLPGREFSDLPNVEHATMSWANAAGFDVPSHFVLASERLDGIPLGWTEEATGAFAVKRFDRRDDGSKVHQEDLCQALDLLSGNKYGDVSPKITFEGALRFVADVCGEAEGREMARRMGFVIASGNGDAHLKNWSLLWGDATKPTLTPCYDFVATIAWRRLGWSRSGGPEVALRFGGEHRFARLDATVVATHAQKSGLPWAEEETMAGIQRARDAWAQVREEAPALMRDAIVTHWASVPLLRAVGLSP